MSFLLACNKVKYSHEETHTLLFHLQIPALDRLIQERVSQVILPLVQEQVEDSGQVLSQEEF